jgi:hypothetical protein
MAIMCGLECASVMTITWTDNFQIYGTKELFNKGGGEYFLALPRHRHFSNPRLSTSCRWGQQRDTRDQVWTTL